MNVLICTAVLLWILLIALIWAFIHGAKICAQALETEEE